MIKTVSTAALSVTENIIIQKNRFENNAGKKASAYVLFPALTGTSWKSSMCARLASLLNDEKTIFPGSPSGSLAETVAHDIARDIEGADICIDIHSSNIFLREIPQVRISEQNEEALLPYARMLNVDLVWIHAAATVLESTLTYSLNMRGVKTLVVEMGVGMRITEDCCAQLFDGIMYLLQNLGMWSEKIQKPRTPVVSKDRSVGFLNSDTAGIFIL